MRIFAHLSLAALLLGLCAAGCKKDNQPAVAAPVEKSPVVASSAAVPVPPPEAAKPADTGAVTVAASVDGITLSREELMQQLQAAVAAQHIPEAQQQMALQYFAPRLVNSFVSKTLLINEAKKSKIVITEADRKKYMKPFEEMAAKQGTTVDELINKAPMGKAKALQELDEQMLIEKLIDTQVRNKVALDDKSIDEALVKAQKERIEKRAQIETIRTQLLAGTNFETIAREQSDCPSGKQSGGDLGKFERTQMVKPFADAAFSQKIGDIGPIVETDFGFHVIKVTAHNEATPASPETVQASHILIKAPPAASRDEVRKQAEDEKVGEAMKTYLADLKSKAKITTMFDKPAGMPGLPGGQGGMQGMPGVQGGMQEDGSMQ